MRIQLDPEWLIDCDQTACQLIRLKLVTGESGRGKPVKAENIGTTREEGCGFYGRLDHALQGYLLKSTNELKDTKTPQELMGYMSQCMTRITAAVAKLPARGVT